MADLIVESEVQIPGFDLLPDTPVGRQARWRLRHLYLRDEHLMPEELVKHVQIPGFGARTAEEFIAVRRGKGPGPFRILDVNSPDSFEIEVTLLLEGDKKFGWSVRIEETPPHRMVKGTMGRVSSKEGLTTRFAEPDDGPALSELDRRCPIVLGDTSLIYDRGDDWFAWTRLMEGITIVVAELHGEIVGVTCGARHPITIGGVKFIGALGVHLRVSPDHQRAGIYPAMMQRFWQSPQGSLDFAGGAAASYGYISQDNAAMQHAWRNLPKWSVPPVRAILACSEVAGSATGRVATPEDAPRIVEILNTCHAREELSSPHTVETLTSRLERARDLYSWGNILLGEGSLVGVWPANLKVIRDTDGERTESSRALVLDHGFLPGYEAEFEALLRDWCGRFVREGKTELSIFTSSPSPNYEIVARMASRLEVFDLSTMNLPEPEGVSERGVYVDQIYF